MHEGGRVSDVKLEGFQGAHVRCVRLIQQRGEFAEHGAGLSAIFAISVAPLTTATAPFLRISSCPVFERAANTTSPAW